MTEELSQYLVSLEDGRERDLQAPCPYTTKPGTPDLEKHMVQHTSKEQTAALWKHVVRLGSFTVFPESSGIT